MRKIVRHASTKPLNYYMVVLYVSSCLLFEPGLWGIYVEFHLGKKSEILSGTRTKTGFLNQTDPHWIPVLLFIN